MKRALIIAAALLLSGCAVGAVIDTTASVVGGAVDGVVYVGESVVDVVAD